MGGPQPILEGLTRTKRQRKGEFPFCLTIPSLCLTAGAETQVFTRPWTGARIYIITSPLFQAGLRLELQHWLFWDSSLQTIDAGFSFHNHVNQLFIIYHFYIYILLVMFLWRTLTYIVPFILSSPLNLLPACLHVPYFACGFPLKLRWKVFFSKL